MDDVKWLMAREIPRLRRYATMLTNDLAQADDLVQDCLERAIRKRHQLKKFGSVRAWLMRILYTRWISETKRHRNKLEHVPIEDVENRLAYFPDQESADTCREVLSAFRTLPDKQRAILGLVVIEGMSYDEAAAVLKLPIGTVRSRLARARETLRNAVADEDPGSNSVGLLERNKGS
ncbi:MAG: sigma-70 family RNA polymerase sigma factor [Rhodospirillales bacterium]